MRFGIVFRTTCFSAVLLASLEFGSAAFGVDYNHAPSVARNGAGVTDYAWVFGADTIMYSRNGCPETTVGSVIAQGTAPEVDVDDDVTLTGGYNCAIVWQALDQANIPRVYLSVNGGSAIVVGQQANGSIHQGMTPRVAISRVGGKIAVAWMLPGPGGPIGSAVMAQSYQIVSGAPVKVSEPFQVNNLDYYGNYFLGGVSADLTGDNFVVTYTRRQGYMQTVGVHVRGFDDLGAPVFSEKHVGGSSGYYLWSDVATYHDGSFVVAWNGGINAARYVVAGGSATKVVGSQWSLGSCTYAYCDCRCNDVRNALPSEQDPYVLSVACERDNPGNYVLTWHSRPGSDNFDVVYVSVCGDDPGGQPCPVVECAACSDYYPAPDIYRYPKAGVDDDGNFMLAHEAMVCVPDASCSCVGSLPYVTCFRKCLECSGNSCLSTVPGAPPCDGDCFCP